MPLLSRTAVASLAVLAATLVFAVVLGFVLAFGSSEPDPWEERWAELGVPEAEFVFLGDLSSSEQKSIRRELRVAQVVLFEHFGAVSSDFTAYLSTNLDLLAERVAVDGTVVPQTWFTCGGVAGQATIYIVLQDCPDSRVHGGPLAHEYFHILQQDAGSLAAWRTAGTARKTGWLDWLVEGPAVYAGGLVSEAQGRVPLDVRREGLRLLWAALGKPLPSTRANQLAPGEYEWYAYNVGFLATEWLVGIAGPEAILNFFRFGGHSAAFEAAFGMTVEGFFAAFAEHQQRVAPPSEWKAGGTVLGREGLALQGMNVYATVRIQGHEWWAGLGETDTQGDFEFAAPASGYAIRLFFQCPSDDIYQSVYVGAWGPEGFVADSNGVLNYDEEAVEPFLDGERDRTGMVIELPETRESLIAKHCER